LPSEPKLDLPDAGMILVELTAGQVKLNLADQRTHRPTLSVGC